GWQAPVRCACPGRLRCPSSSWWSVQANLLRLFLRALALRYSGEQGLEPGRRDAKLRKNGGVLAESTQGGTTIQLLWNNNSISRHEAQGAKIPGNQRVVLLAADGGTVGTNDEFVAGIAIARGASGQPQIVTYSLARFVDERIVVVDGPDHAHRR